MLNASRTMRVEPLKHHTLLQVVAISVLVSIALPAAGGWVVAQQLTPQQIQQLSQNPEQVRQQIRQSGLTEQQIRARLAAAGFSPDILDAYLGADPWIGSNTAPGSLPQD